MLKTFGLGVVLLVLVIVIHCCTDLKATRKVWAGLAFIETLIVTRLLLGLFGGEWGIGWILPALVMYWLVNGDYEEEADEDKKGEA